VLAALGTKLGLDPAETRAAILSDDAAEAFRAGHQEAVRLSIRGVPLFVVNGKVAFGGAQPAPFFKEAFRVAGAETNIVNPPTESCALDHAGTC
jgi:predicted DsbA family dithiol-disulfide isomerase